MTRELCQFLFTDVELPSWEDWRYRGLRPSLLLAQNITLILYAYTETSFSLAEIAIVSLAFVFANLSMA